jgi:uncharacterized caspase-like protein
VAQQLRDLGFEMTLLLDLDKAGFEAKVRDFAGSLNGAEAAVFFYAGHGLQVDGRNYMVPVDADVANEADLPFQLVSLDIALQRLATERITNIVILDACRNNPLSEKLAKRARRSQKCCHGRSAAAAQCRRQRKLRHASGRCRHPFSRLQ